MRFACSCFDRVHFDQSVCVALRANEWHPTDPSDDKAADILFKMQHFINPVAYLFEVFQRGTKIELEHEGRLCASPTFHFRSSRNASTNTLPVLQGRVST